MSKYIVVALAIAASASAHSHHHQYRHPKRGPTKVVARQNPPYPTGPGYDVVPLESITALSPAFTDNAVPVPTIFPAGSQPPIPNAPPIPQFNLADTPWPQDWSVPPPTDSPQVQKWLKELEGHDIPNIAPNKPVPPADGNGVTCGDNPDAVTKAADNCWWTCGGCVRSTDISTCKDKMTWGQTFDDGPGYFTPKLLAYLESVGTKATFFLEGGPTIAHPETVVYQHMTGHEFGVHTWSHPALTTLTNEQIVSELGWTREAIKQVTGVTPLLFRPPYGDIDDRVRAIAHAMNLIPVLWTSIPDGNGGVTEWDSNDWRVHGGQVQAVENQNEFYGILDKSSSLDTGIIVLQHDVYAETVNIAIGATIPHALAHDPKFTYSSVQKCQGTDIGNAYLETTTQNPPVPAFGSSSNNTNNSSGNNNSSGTSKPSGTKTGSATVSHTATAGVGAASQLRLEIVPLTLAAVGVIAGSLLL